MQSVTVSSRPVQVFIDVPNVMRGAQRPRIYWPELCRHIEAHLLPGEYIHRSTAYTLSHGRVNNDSALYADILADLSKQELTLNGHVLERKDCGREKDVDLHLLNDIWHSLVYFARAGYPRVRHILVSGDSDFMMAYRDATHELTSFRVELDVYTWSYKHAADCFKNIPHRVVHLDTIPNLIDLTTARLFAKS